MVSFWPFGKDNTSAASFEKALSQLSAKINKATAQNDNFRQRQRRYKVLWTLYTTFAYILVAAILTLVTGYQRWGAPEYTAVVGSPVFIFLIRMALDAYYNYRLSNNQTYLNDLNKQRDKVIQKLKTATHYDSTQQLLDKYGGSPRQQRQPSPRAPKKRKSEGPQSNQSAPQGQRTGFAPPPTANIQRPPSAGPVVPQGPTGPLPPGGQSPMQASLGPSEEFAPNAFGVPNMPPPNVRQPSQQYSEGPKWYDRILDVVLGEDETQAKNRIVLICQNCRLVNGQAPPGARTPEDVGRWRCSSCQAWNGVESEEKKMLKQISGAPIPLGGADESSDALPQPVAEEQVQVDGAASEDEGDADVSSSEPVDNPPAASTRSKARQRKKA